MVGFDDLPVARFLSPPLTTVRAPIEQVGREAIRQVVRLIRGEPADRLSLMQTELVLREIVRLFRRFSRSQGPDVAKEANEIKHQLM